jgi:hypothetical protein
MILIISLEMIWHESCVKVENLNYWKLLDHYE